MAWFLVDEAALRRCTGTAETMAAQLDHLVAVAGLPSVTIQVVPNVAHAALTGGTAIASGSGRAAQIETALTDQVFEDADAVRELATRFDALRTKRCEAPKAFASSKRWQANGDSRQLAQVQLLRRQRRRVREIATTADTVLVRDSKNRTGNALTFSVSAWRAFVSAVK